jgi:hypothetical protein
VDDESFIGPGNETVYVVDDDRTVGEALSELLQGNGKEVQMFNSGTEFLSIERKDGAACLYSRPQNSRNEWIRSPEASGRNDDMCPSPDENGVRVNKTTTGPTDPSAPAHCLQKFNYPQLDCTRYPYRCLALIHGQDFRCLRGFTTINSGGGTPRCHWQTEPPAARAGREGISPRRRNQ